MDKNLREELGIERRITVSESVEVPRPSVQSLLEVIKQLFASPNKPIRFLYIKGEPLVVEKGVPESKLDEDNPFITAFQMVRQHAEVQIIEAEVKPLEQVCRAAIQLSEREYSPTMFVVSNREALDKWFTFGRAEHLFRIPVIEDPECPDDFLIMCGSQSGRMLSQIEYAVFCRMEAP